MPSQIRSVREKNSRINSRSGFGSTLGAVPRTRICSPEFMIG